MVSSEPEQGGPDPPGPAKEDPRISRFLPWVGWASGVTVSVISGVEHHEGPAAWILRGLLWLVDAAVRLKSQGR